MDIADFIGWLSEVGLFVGLWVYGYRRLRKA
jgi:hypothetical protein